MYNVQCTMYNCTIFCPLQKQHIEQAKSCLFVIGNPMQITVDIALDSVQYMNVGGGSIPRLLVFHYYYYSPAGQFAPFTFNPICSALGGGRDTHCTHRHPLFITDAAQTPPLLAETPTLLPKLDQGTLGMSDPLQLTFDQLGTDS